MGLCAGACQLPWRHYLKPPGAATSPLPIINSIYCSPPPHGTACHPPPLAAAAPGIRHQTARPKPKPQPGTRRTTTENGSLLRDLSLALRGRERRRLPQLPADGRHVAAGWSHAAPSSSHMCTYMHVPAAPTQR